MKVAIVLPTGNQAREPAATAIQRAKSSLRPGDSLHVIESSGPEFRFSRSVNRGIAQAPDADAWVLLNDDCFMDAGWLDSLTATAQAHPEVGIVGAVLRYPNGDVQHAGGRLMPTLGYLAYCIRKKAPLWGLRATWARMTRGAPYFGHYAHLNTGNRLDFVTGACMLITRACHDAIGGYDESYEFTFEDIDYCLRARRAGFEIAMATTATGIHLERATGARLKHAITRSGHQFQQRWNLLNVHALTSGRRGIYHGGP